MMNTLQWLVLPVALVLGLALFALFGLFISGAESKREERIAELTSRHHTQSTAETNALTSLIYQAMAQPAGSPARAKLDEQYNNLKSVQQDAWNARVQEIVELECPVPDETFEELDRELRARGW